MLVNCYGSCVCFLWLVHFAPCLITVLAAPKNAKMSCNNFFYIEKGLRSFSS